MYHSTARRNAALNLSPQLHWLSNDSVSEMLERAKPFNADQQHAFFTVLLSKARDARAVNIFMHLLEHFVPTLANPELTRAHYLEGATEFNDVLFLVAMSSDRTNALGLHLNRLLTTNPMFLYEKPSVVVQHYLKSFNVTLIELLTVTTLSKRSKAFLLKEMH